ncbi:hypothetical protein Bequi_03200 [Brachybacterium sp. JHP9]|uniref:Permease n=1 Tax=Brachybacterium equifaecis TaxID=2910770 RepID=A0ABT0QXM5_9MICO|nr:hypothetical protein [Brachybacterium equifaecis]MCL6422399.1 hypothetical protein [Brachybacterium equifaecis]
MIASERTPLGAALAVLLALVALTGPHSAALMAALMCLLSIMIGIGWPDLLELASPRGTRIVVAGTGVLAALLTLGTASTDAPLGSVVIACALGIFGAFAHQMVRRERDGLSASLTSTIAGVMLTGISATWVLAQAEATTGSEARMLAACGAGLAITLLITATGLPRLLRLALAVLASAGATAVLMPALTSATWPLGMLVGALLGVGAGGVHLLLGSVLVAKEPLPSLTVAAAPVATIGMVALLAARLLG